jgi:hypothetical protein
MKWCDILRVKSEFPINLWPNAVQAYYRWIRTCVKENMPYDRFVREMLTASGSNFRVAQGITDKRQQDRRELLHMLNSFGRAMQGDAALGALDQAEEQAYELILGDAGQLLQQRCDSRDGTSR